MLASFANGGTALRVEHWTWRVTFLCYS